MTISDDDLSTWEQLASAATPGQWVSDCDEPLAAETYAEVCVEDDYGSHSIATEMTCADARFLMAARDAMPRLCDRVQELEGAQILNRNAIRLQREAREAVEAERDALRRRYEDCSAKNERLVSELTAVAGERDALRAEASELRASLADAVGKIEVMRVENERLEAEVDALNARIGGLT